MPSLRTPRVLAGLVDMGPQASRLLPDSETCCFLGTVGPILASDYRILTIELSKRNGKNSALRHQPVSMGWRIVADADECFQRVRCDVGSSDSK